MTTENNLKTSSLDQKLNVNYYVCQVYGNIIPGRAPEKCAICGATASRFRNVG